MRQDLVTAQEVVSKARELLAGANTRIQQDTLKAIISIYDALANTISIGEPQMDPGPAGFDFTEWDGATIFVESRNVVSASSVFIRPSLRPSGHSTAFAQCGRLQIYRKA
jgi:hypothetical protein